MAESHIVLHISMNKAVITWKLSFDFFCASIRFASKCYVLYFPNIFPLKSTAQPTAVIGVLTPIYTVFQKFVTFLSNYDL